MDRRQIEDTLRRHKPFLSETFKVKRIGVFGSYAKDRQTDRSDIDILVEFREAIGWDFLDLKDFLEQTLGRKVDLVTINALKRQLKDDILAEVVYA